MEEATNTDQAQGEGLNMPVLQEMAKAGILFGRKRSVTHPKMREFIFGTRNKFEIIDLQKTLSQIQAAQEFLVDTASTGQPILYVGTRPEVHDIIKESAEKFNYPYVTQRWPGGALTNFKTINERIGYYVSLKDDQSAGKLDKYTKKEQVSIEKKIARMDRLFSGLAPLNRLPGALIVVGVAAHKTAIREAQLKNIPIIAIANTDSNPKNIDYLIPANDNNRAGIKMILDMLASAIEEGRTKVKSAPTPEEAPKKETK